MLVHLVCGCAHSEIIYWAFSPIEKKSMVYAMREQKEEKNRRVRFTASSQLAAIIFGIRELNWMGNLTIIVNDSYGSISIYGNEDFLLTWITWSTKNVTNKEKQEKRKKAAAAAVLCTSVLFAAFIIFCLVFSIRFTRLFFLLFCSVFSHLF